MGAPLVSVICLCYNHRSYVREAIESVLQQTYPNVELIVVDDASTDSSVSEIQMLLNAYPVIRFLSLPQNVGNCKAFNQGWLLSKGEYIIDLAADDVLMPTRIEEGIMAFKGLPDAYGVNFSDAEWIGARGEHLYMHSDRFPHHTIPQGDVYQSLIDRYFICSPSMMIKRTVMDDLGGYDERLTYEDFDFWIRSARNFKFCYTPKVLVKKRVLDKSLSKKQFSRGSQQQKSTYQVCEKIFGLNRTKEEFRALQRRIRYEIGVSLRFLHVGLMIKYFALWIRTSWRN